MDDKRNTAAKALLRRTIIELDRLWGDAALGLALCESGENSVLALANMIDATEATTRRRLESLVRIGRVTKSVDSRQTIYTPKPDLHVRTRALVDRLIKA
jgi:hypothetical protein